MVESVTAGTGGPNGRRHPSVPCPQSMAGSPHPAADPEPYPPTELSYAEAASLVGTAAEIERTVSEHGEQLRKASRELIARWHRAKAALDSLAMLDSRQDLSEAGQAQRQVRAWQAQDGGEDRRHRPWWLAAPVVWTLIGISAIYDAVFFAGTFRQAVDTGGTPPPLADQVAYVPGVAIAMALILAGSWLAVPLFRHRARAERRTRRGRLDWRIVLRRVFLAWRPDEQQRDPADLPWPSWPLPVAFGTVVVVVLGTWAWLRSVDIRDVNQRVPIVALLVLLTVTAIAFKAAAHNPYADRAKAVEKQWSTTLERFTVLQATARTAVSDLYEAWQDLRLVTTEVAGESRRQIVVAWAAVANGRAQHQLAGMVAPSFASVDDDLIGCLVFVEVAGPPLRVAPLREAIATLDRYPPADLEKDLEGRLERLNQQLAVGLGASPAH